MRILEVASILAWVTAFGLGMSSCSSSSTPAGSATLEEPPDAVVIDPYRGVLLSVAEAEELLGFEFQLPADLPDGVLNPPQLQLQEAFADEFDLLAVYLPDRGAPYPLKIILTYAEDAFALPLNAARTFEINGLNFDLVIDRSKDYPILYATTEVNDSGLFLQMAWTESASDSVSDDLMIAACTKLITEITEDGKTSN